MNKKIDLIAISQRSKSNKTFMSNQDSENLEETEKTSRKITKIKTKKSKSKKKKRKKSNKGKVKIPDFPILKKSEMKLEEKTEIEFVLGDFNDFHSIGEIKLFNNVTSLTLINESIKSISLITENLPNPSIMKSLCLNQNEIDNLNGIQILENLEALQINFNYIETIPPFFKTLKYLHTFWICENNVSILENIPKGIQNFWIANNEIEEIPENFDELENLEILNISGNFINDLKYLYILGKIKKLKRIYLCDINFGENPICLFNNYRKIMVHIFNSVEIIDQIKVTYKEKDDVEKFFIDNVIINNDKIKQNFKICKMIFRLMKTFNFFCTNIELFKIKALSLKLKELEYNLYEKSLFDNNTTDIISLNDEIKIIKNEIDNSLSKCENCKTHFYELKNRISSLNDLSIVLDFYKLETNNNIKIEPGNIKDKWAEVCINLMKYQLSEDFSKKNELEGVSINQIYKIKNKKSKFVFNALFDELLDEYNQFGSDEKFFKYFFLILPEDITKNKRKLFKFLFENQNEEENFFLCDNYTFIDEFQIKKENEYRELYGENKKFDEYISILCKCSFFEKNIEIIDGRYNFFSSLEEIQNYLINLKSNTYKDIICLKLKNNIKFYYYTNKGLIQPKYIIEYNYKRNKDIYSLAESFNFISSFENLINFNDEKEKLFNICSRYMLDLKNNIATFINIETLNKYCLSKFFEYKEIENFFFFFIKNSLFNYLNNCFKYINEEEYFNEVKLLNKKIKEIKKFSFENSFINIYNCWKSNKKKNDSKSKEINSIQENSNDDNNYLDEKNKSKKIKNILDKINFSNLKSINLFNCELTDESINDLLNKIKNDSLQYEEIRKMTEICEELLISKNNLSIINLSEIIKIFPNIKKIDLSHNNLKNLTFSNNNIITIESKIRYIDISYNNITNFNIIIKVIKEINCGRFIFYANPFERKFEKLIDYYQNGIMKEEFKEMLLKKNEELLKDKENKNSILKIGEDIKIKKITKLFDYIYNFYSFSDEFRLFNDCIYFRDIIKYNNEGQINIAYLNNKNLLNIPIIEGNNDIQIMYLNSNKIIKISNLSNFYNLKELFLQNNKIKIIENLPRTLKKLDLSNNYIDNLTGIESLIYLEWINLENNNIKKISILIKLINLVEIYCSNNLIENFSDCSQLEKLKNLEIFDISGNEIVNSMKNLRITIIYYCPNLKFLNRNLVNETERNSSLEYFNGKLTTDLVEKRIKEKSNSSNLIELNLSSLKLKDEFELFSEKTYPKLKKLNLSKNNFTSFIIFGNLPQLIDLNLSNNIFVDLFSKKNQKSKEKSNFNLSNLLYLDLSVNQIVNLNGIQYFSKLKTLNIKENAISKIDQLDKMNELNYLNISFNKLRSCDKTNVGTLPALKIFLCDNNYLKYINCFEKFYSVEILSFNNNKITDMGCLEKLSNLKKLTHLSIINNPITKISNYRKILFYILQNLKVLDNKEIGIDEKIININHENNNSKYNNKNYNYYNNNYNNYSNNYQNYENYTKDDDSFGVSFYNFNIYNNNNNNISNNIINNKNNNTNISLFKNQKQRVNYIQIGYNMYPFRRNKFFLSSHKKDNDKKKKIRNKSLIQTNINLVENQLKNKNVDTNRHFAFSKRNVINNNYFPAIGESVTLSKNKNKNDIKMKYSFNAKSNRNGSVILSNEKQNKAIHRPQSTTRIPSSKNRGNASLLNNQDYFSIVLNSVNNHNEYNSNQLITLKNWNIRKINFDVKK